MRHWRDLPEVLFISRIGCGADLREPADSPNPWRHTVIDRRMFMTAAGSLLLGACTATGRAPAPAPAPAVQPLMLLPKTQEPFPIAAVDLSKIDPIYHRQIVDDPTGEPAGTIVVDIDNRFLHLVLEGGKSLRYGVGIGREGFAWNGRATIERKAKWPRWVPTPYMIRTDPAAAKVAGGVPGGIDNPLGARALYLYQDGRDTLYRLHGTSEPSSIGRAVSSGCVRLLNADVIDLYDRVPLGTPVLVLTPASGPVAHSHEA